jgi:hypothetical protein
LEKRTGLLSRTAIPTDRGLFALSVGMIEGDTIYIGFFFFFFIGILFLE